jgi:hypothetical protein
MKMKKSELRNMIREMLHEELSKNSSITEARKVNKASRKVVKEAVSTKITTKFNKLIQQADLLWIKAILELGIDYDYFDVKTANKLYKAAYQNAAAGVTTATTNATAQDLCRTKVKTINDAFARFISEEAGDFDRHLEFYNDLFIGYIDGTSEYINTYDNNFNGDKDKVECVIGIDYASGASIDWVRGEDDEEELDELLQIYE